MKKFDVWVLPSSLGRVRTCGVPLAFKAIGYHTQLSGLSEQAYGLPSFTVNRANEAVFNMDYAKSSLNTLYAIASSNPSRKYYMLPIGPKCPRSIFERIVEGRPSNCLVPASWINQSQSRVVIEGTKEADRDGKTKEFAEYVGTLCRNLRKPVALITEGHSECSRSIERIFQGRVLTVPSDFNTLGADALRIRNYQMAFEATHGVIYNDASAGGQGVINAARRCTLPVRVFKKSRAYTCLQTT